MKLTNILCTAAMLCLLSACSTDPISDEETSTNLETTFTAENDRIFAEEVLDAINAHRASLNLSLLEWHSDSGKVATEHSNYMAINNKASHDNFMQRSQFLKNRGAHRVSENVAYGFSDAESVVQGWLSSDSHRDALEGNFTHTGIGVIKNDNGIPFFTQIFIK